jgi:hypothetical protein
LLLLLPLPFLLLQLTLLRVTFLLLALAFGSAPLLVFLSPLLFLSLSFAVAALFFGSARLIVALGVVTSAAVFVLLFLFPFKSSLTSIRTILGGSRVNQTKGKAGDDSGGYDETSDVS